MEQRALENVKQLLKTNIYSYLETSGEQSSNLYLDVHFLKSVLIRHLWQLETVVSLHWCLICTVLFWICQTHNLMKLVLTILKNVKKNIIFRLFLCQTNGWTQTLNIWKMRRVFYCRATAFGILTIASIHKLPFN